ncbi:hypothetical protein AAFC00_000979 [Neodothiora populina]|uniref:BTB domain-containing protein n=1 Tax=Neodothiora populina TaxID=2781224 RepID=A0ABR3PMF0_9PEZI
MGSPRNELMSALSSLHLGGKYSDLTVRCHSRQWAVHRAILCSRSSFFDGACSNQFLEAKTGVIELDEDDEEAVEHMIHYFYHLDYLEPESVAPASAIFQHRAHEAQRNRPQKIDLSQIEDPLFAQARACAPPTPTTPSSERSGFQLARHDSTHSRSSKSKSNRPVKAVSASPSDSEDECYSEEDEEYETDESNLLTHIRVYALAEKYGVSALKDLAKRKFECQMACFYDSPEFADAVEEVYCSTIDSDRGLRDVVLQAFRSHPQLASTQDVFAVIKSTPSLAFELWKVERGLPVV